MRTIALALLVVFLLLLIVFSGPLQDRLALNLTALDTLHILYSDEPFLAARPAWLGESRSCTTHWMAALQAEGRGDLETRDQAFRQAVTCDPQYVTYLHRMYPEDVSMAQMALAYQPSSAESWFWAGDLLPDKKIEYYQQGLRIDPEDGLRWIVLGDLLNESDPETALQAYLQGCYHGDPGFNACGRAGSVAERMGLYDEAIEYYRLSSYGPFREKADQLEATLTPQP